MNSRMDSVAENLMQHRKWLEDTLQNIDSATRDDHSVAFLHGDDGMPTAGRTTTGVAVIDLFAKEQDRKKRSGGAKAKLQTGGQEKWLKPEGKSQTTEEGPAELSPFMSFLDGIFGCCSVSR